MIAHQLDAGAAGLADIVADQVEIFFPLRPLFHDDVSAVHAHRFQHHVGGMAIVLPAHQLFAVPGAIGIQEHPGMGPLLHLFRAGGGVGAHGQVACIEAAEKIQAARIGRPLADQGVIIAAGMDVAQPAHLEVGQHAPRHIADGGLGQWAQQRAAAQRGGGSHQHPAEIAPVHASPGFSCWGQAKRQAAE